MLTKRERIRKSAKNLRNRLAPSRGPARAVFLLGEMRSGTNMLTECFDSTPGTEIFNENDEAAFDGFELRDLETIRGLVAGSRASHVVFKAIADSARATTLLDEFPGSRVIWIYRRYQDVVNSALRKWHQHNDYLRMILEDPARARWRAVNLDVEDVGVVRRLYSKGLSEASARSLIWWLRNSAFFRQELHGRDAVLLINYEHLVSRPTEELQRALLFAGLPFGRDSFSHVTTDSVSRDPPREIDPEVRELCDAMKARLDAARASAPPASQRAQLTS